MEAGGGSKEPPAPPVRGGVSGLRQGPGEGSGQVMGTPCSRIAWEREAGRQAPRTHRLAAERLDEYGVHGVESCAGSGERAQAVGSVSRTSRWTWQVRGDFVAGA